MSIQDQESMSPGEHQVIDTLEWFAALLFIGWLIRRIVSRHHYASGVILLIRAV